jgi:pimeloyl-ACP methyl ester carboxylesterase
MAQIQHPYGGDRGTLPRHRSRHGAPGLIPAVSDPDWAFHADDGAVLEALADGTHAASLRAYFGAAGYAQLGLLAADGRRKLRHGPQILILPGIMGSKLGTASRRRNAGGMVWFDPAAIATGGLRDLALPEGRRLVPRGVLLFAYARLQLRLRQQGFDAVLHAYDWRLGLDELGRTLAARIAGSRRPVILIGHSMGGLVARMALGMLPKRSVRKLILLGTPNFGSFAVAQALRGTYEFARKVSRLDLEHSPQYLARRVFHTFPGLHQLLPAGEARNVANLCTRASWPAKGLTPDERLLAQIAPVRARLAPPDERVVQIAGVNRATIVNVHRKEQQFEYEMGWRGDGTVPLALALLPKIRTYYVDELHARLPCNGDVIRAIIGLVRSGRTRALPQRWHSRRDALPRTDDAALRRAARGKIDWRALDARTREAVLADLNS